MKEVAKDEFKRIYFELGGGRGGWTTEYWNQNFEDNPRSGMKFKVEMPENERETTMWIISDFAVNEYRLFFRTPEHSDDMLVFPETD
jgi:hypothetical protein